MATKAPALPGDSIGTNVTCERNGNIMILRIELSQKNGVSKSGKSQIIATTSGNAKVGDVVVGLNIYTKA